MCILHILHIFAHLARFLSHEINLPYTERLDLIDYEIELNPALQICGRSSEVKVSHTNISNIFCTTFREL